MGNRDGMRGTEGPSQGAAFGAVMDRGAEGGMRR